MIVLKKVLLFFLGVVIIIVWLCIPKKTLNTNSLAVKAIYIDPGHGGLDGGMVAPNGLYEKDIVLDICFYLKYLFEGNGYTVYLTRDGDYDLALKNSQNRKREDIHKRVKLINESSALFYLSIHANSYSSPIIYGAQTFYNATNSKSKLLAECIQDSIKDYLKNTKRYALAINDKYLIDNVKKPGCLVEVGFLSNPRELELLQSEDYKQKMASAIYFGVLDYLEKDI